MPKPVSDELPESKLTPDPKLVKRARRDFTAEYKHKIIEKADACAHGELGPMLREQGLHSG